MMNPIKPITVLVAEDDSDDQLNASDLLRRISFVREVRCVADGDELLNYLRRQGDFREMSDWRRPDLVLLDLYMPRKGGLEALEELKADPELSGIPVVVLTSSETGNDIRRAFELGAKSYMLKPLTMQRLTVGLQPKQTGD